MADLTNISTHLEAIRSKVGRTFERGGWRSEDGDSLYFFNESADHYRERVDDVLTVYRAESNRRIIGVQIKGVSELPEHDAAAVMVECGESGAYSVLLLLFVKLRERENTLVSSKTRLSPQETQSRLAPYWEAVKAFNVSGPLVPVENN